MITTKTYKNILLEALESLFRIGNNDKGISVILVWGSNYLLILGFSILNLKYDNLRTFLYKGCLKKDESVLIILDKVS